jgi:hypothetical protein
MTVVRKRLFFVGIACGFLLLSACGQSKPSAAPSVPAGVDVNKSGQTGAQASPPKNLGAQ